MRTWVIEIRDRDTCIPALAVHMYADDKKQAYWIHGRCGHPRDGSGLAVIKLHSGECHFDPYAWGQDTRTMVNAHNWMIHHIDALVDCMVVDVRVILGEATVPAKSETEEK